MFVLYAILVSVFFVISSYIYIKTFQLENYHIEKYLKKTIQFEFAFGRKTPLVFTNRVKRLSLCVFLIIFLVLLLIFGLVRPVWVDIVLAVVLFILFPLWIAIPFTCMSPIEKLIKKNFIRRAKKKLKSCACKVIAITGSFGKTSTKNILYQILKEEFDVCATPKSYNTPMGICKTVLENLKDTDDFFVVEFGARRVGDIEELARIVGVDFGIITPIENCHLETFGTVENLENTKYELCEHAKDIVVFNGKSKSSRKLFERYPRQKYLVCEENSFAYAKDVEVSSEGSSFTLIIDGRMLACTTTLLGKANIDNVVVACAMAYLLGESLLSIQKAIFKLKSTPHRLELIRGFANVIDDSYNSNLEGFKDALNVLSGFSGRKIVVSPGIIELGKCQYEVNRLAGIEVGKTADVFVVMNDVNKKALVEGATSVREEGKAKLEVMFAKSREEQKKVLKSILRKGDCVLFENDLPDNIK